MIRLVSSRLSLAQSSSEDKSDQVNESSSKPESDLPLYSDSASVVVAGASVPSVLSPQDDSVVAVSGRKVVSESVWSQWVEKWGASNRCRVVGWLGLGSRLGSR